MSQESILSRDEDYDMGSIYVLSIEDFSVRSAKKALHGFIQVNFWKWVQGNDLFYLSCVTSRSYSVIDEKILYIIVILRRIWMWYQPILHTLVFSVLKYKTVWVMIKINVFFSLPVDINGQILLWFIKRCSLGSNMN